MVHTVFCTISTEQKILKQLCNHYFSAIFWLLLLSNKGRTTQNLKIKKTLIVRFGIFGVLMLVLFQQFTGDV